MIAENTFIFDGFEVAGDRRSLTFRYSMSVDHKPRLFREVVELPEPVPDGIPPRILDSLMQSLHLALGMSYWKLACPEKMEIKGYRLTAGQAEFWNILYTRGLGEFFYRNNIDFRGLIKFPFTGGSAADPTPLKVQERSLVGIAGGKDSLVSVRLLQSGNMPFSGIVFETGKSYPLINEVLSELRIPNLKIKRTIDPQLYELNTHKVFNGHIPISAIYAFLGVAAASFYGYKYMIVSNERSANYGNVEYLGMEVNHQWSKSAEFERLFSEYVNKFLSPDVTYFSLLRPLNELQIVREFVKYPELFTHFSSCNANFKVHRDIQVGKWCGTCPKCAFVFSLLAAYLPKAEVMAIFRKDMLNDPGMVQTYRQLLGISDSKPFECVGTPEEVRAAFDLILKKGEFDNEAAVSMYATEVLPSSDHPGSAQLIPAETTETRIPAPFHKLLDAISI